MRQRFLSHRGAFSLIIILGALLALIPGKSLAATYVNSTGITITTTTISIGGGDGAGAYATSSYPVLTTAVSGSVVYWAFYTGDTWGSDCGTNMPFIDVSGGIYRSPFNFDGKVGSTPDILVEGSSTTSADIGPSDEWYVANAASDCTVKGENLGTFETDRPTTYVPWFYLGDTPLSLGAISSLGQSQSVPGTAIPAGGISTGGTVTLSALLSSTNSSTLQFQVEVEPTGSSFMDTPNATSTVYVSSGNVATATYSNVSGNYHWQAREFDGTNYSSWQTFGVDATSTVDFTISNDSGIDFDDYSAGTLIGQQGWGGLDASGTVGLVTSTSLFSGSQALLMQSYDGSGDAGNDQIQLNPIGPSSDMTGTIDFYSDDGYIVFDFSDTTNRGAQTGMLRLDGSNDLQILTPATTWYTVGSYDGSDVQQLEYEFNGASSTYRAQLIGGSGWSPWEGYCISLCGGGTTVNYLSISSNNDHTPEGYLDYLDVNPDPVTSYYAQIENTSTLNLQTESSTTSTILKTLPADWIIQIVTSTDVSGNPIISGGYHWLGVVDPTDGVTGWMAASSSGSQYISSYDGSSQSTFEDMASTTQDDEASRATVIQAAVDHYYTNTSSTGSLYSSDDLSDVFNSSSPDTYPEDLIFPIAAWEDGSTGLDNEEVTFDYGHGIMQITPTPSSSDIYFLQKILNSDPDTQVATSGPGSPGMESDHFGTATENAVERFQTKYGLASSGQVLYYTRAQLNSMLPTSSIPSSFKFERNLVEGMTDNTSSYSEARGIESGVYIPPCGNLQDPSTSTYYQLCYGDNTSTDPKAYAPQPDYGNQVFKWYANTSQSIYSNIKDGLEILKEKYDACYDGSGGICDPTATTTSLDGETFTYDQKRDILATWGYNGFVTSTGVSYLTDIADTLANINSYFSSIPDPATSTGSWYNKLTVAADNLDTFRVMSPVDVSIVDSEGRATGVVNGTAIAQIPNSEYNPQTETGVVLFPSDAFTFNLKGTANDTYGFIVTSNDNSATTTVYQALDIPIKTGAIHTYTIDFNKLRLGEPGVTVKMDDNGDGKIDRTVTNIGTVSFVGPPKFVAPSFPVATPKPKPAPPAPRIFQIQSTIPTSTPTFTSSTLRINSSSPLATSSFENSTSTIEIASSTIQINSSTESNE
jgi:hypothetical protein